MIAGLPMYDLPGLEMHHDRFWRAVRNRLRAAGVDAPPRLARDRAAMALWTDPNLLLGQTCGYPLLKTLAGEVQLVATPRYRAPGCAGAAHRSLIIARRSDPREGICDFRGARCAVNDEGSNTGMNLLRAEIACLARACGRPFFGEVLITGSHSASLDAVVEGRADITAVDCVTFALLQRLRPTGLEGARIIGFSAPTPGLPLIAARSQPPEVILALREALAAVALDPTLKPTLQALLIDGFTQVPQVHYRAVLHVEQIAVSQGYPKLH